ncbi:MAG: gamma-glutamyltransferase family protein [Polyangiaceae bacterium]|nr:gamma-glutamyltransferase family protein [Polyangiaceae bacterium]
MPAASEQGRPAPEGPSGFAEKPGRLAKRFMVAAAHPLATRAGYDVLSAGGSAVDAAIAVQMVLNLVEPQSSGIGGGAFLTHYDGRRVEVFDGRETAPRAASADLFMQHGRPMAFMDAVVGGRSVGVPGLVSMLELCHREHGRVPWQQLFQPAIELAERGFPISARLATLLRSSDARSLRDDPDARAYFYTPEGSAKTAHTLLKNPEFATVLRQIAERGSAALYRGAVARDLVAKVRRHPRNPGLLTEADLAGYQPKRRDALCVDSQLWRICGPPPPSSGTLAIGQILGMLEQRPLQALGPVRRSGGLELSVEAVHRVTEAERLAFADRDRYVADPDFVPLPGGSPRALLDPVYLAKRAQLIGERSMGHASPGNPAGSGALGDGRTPELPSTSHVSIVDPYGNALSMTSTIEHGFGAQIMVRGFLLNNELTDFSLTPTEHGLPVANRVEANKRPRSSMAPLLVFRRDSGELVLSVGSPGGSAIINYVTKVLVATMAWSLDLQTAIALPNFGSRNGPTELETGRVSERLVRGLEAKGHIVSLGPQTSGLQGIQRIWRGGQAFWLGCADPRRDGLALGE